LNVKKSHITLLLFLLLSLVSKAQVSVKVDTTHIRIGEQITYEISTDDVAAVQFPELVLDSLQKVEMLHESAIDTLKKRLYKKYYLTSFDSGAYRIPAQKVLIAKQVFFTDSLLIRVDAVAVDTLKQKLFPIKSIYKAKPKTFRDYQHYLWLALLSMLVVAVFIWFVFYKKKGITKKNRIALTPIERALKQFKNLDEKHLLKNQRVKEYYIELTNIVRDYIGKDVNIPTLEVTTDELITLLEIHNKSNKIGLDKERISVLHHFLKQADLVKFAKATPDSFQIKNDRVLAEEMVNSIEAVVHKPIYDDLGNEIKQESLAEIEAKRTKKQRFKIIIIASVLVVLGVLTSILYYGFNTLKDNLIGHPTKELLEAEWYQSSYGYPSISVETPKILKATKVDLPKQAQQLFVSKASFSYGSLVEKFYILLNTTEFTPQAQINLDIAVEATLKMIAAQEGVSDLKYDISDRTNNAISGKKITGTILLNNQKMNFTQYIFVADSTMQQLMLLRRDDDEYARKINERIEKSLTFQKIQHE